MTTNGEPGSDAPLPRSIFVAVFLLSLAVLMVQIALNRIFSFLIWYHFAYISVSLALLGFGASGSMVAAFPGLIGRSIQRTIGIYSAICACTSVLMLIVVGMVPLNPFEIFTNSTELGKFVVYFIVVSIPFFFAGVAITVALRAAGSLVNRLYFWDLIGAGLGCALVVLAIDLLETPRVLILVALNAATGAALIQWSSRRHRLPAAILAAATVLIALFAIPADFFRNTFEARFGRLFMYREQVTDIVMVTEGPKDHFVIRYGDGRGTAGTITVLEDRSYAHMAMLLHPEPRRVLSICFGVGNSLSSLAQYPVDRIDAVELSPGVIEAAPFFRATNRDVLSDPRVHLTIEDGRNFLLVSHDLFDVIRLVASFNTSDADVDAFLAAANRHADAAG